MRGVALRALAAGTLVAVAFPAVAAARVELKRIDTRAYPNVRAVVVTSKPSAQAPVVREDGIRVTGLHAENLGDSRSIVLAIDCSRSMAGQSFQDAIAAARTFLASKRQGDRISVVSFGSGATQLTGFSSARIDADTALRSLAVEDREGTALYDAIRLSSRALRGEEARARVIVVLTDGRDVSSTATFAQAVRAARAARATVYPVGIEGSQFSPDPLHRIANDTGGSYRGAASTEALPRIYAQIARELRRTWRVEYVTAARPGDRVRLQAAVAGQGAARAVLSLPAAHTGAGHASAGLLPQALYTSGWARLLFALLIGLIILLAARLALSRPAGAWARERVAAHVEPAPSKPSGLLPRRPSRSLAELYAVTERSLSGQRAWGSIERLLERADLPLRTAEFVYLSAACGVSLGLLSVLVGLPGLLALVAFAAGAVAPLGVVASKARRRVRAFEDQLPDLLITLAASLRAGHGLRQAIQGVVAEGQEPAKKELGRVVAEASLGRPMEEALADMARRLESDDFDYVVTAITVQREVGGALAGLFDMVADTVRARHQFRRKVRSLTAMGRLSAFILVALPFFVAVALTALNPDYMRPLYHSSAGHTLVIVGLTGMVVGSLLLKKIVSFRG